MSAWVTFVTDIMGVTLATVDTTAITLGLVVAVLLIFSVALFVFRRIRGRG